MGLLLARVLPSILPEPLVILLVESWWQSPKRKGLKTKPLPYGLMDTLKRRLGMSSAGAAPRSRWRCRRTRSRDDLGSSIVLIRLTSQKKPQPRIRVARAATESR